MSTKKLAGMHTASSRSVSDRRASIVTMTASSLVVLASRSDFARTAAPSERELMDL